MLSHFNKYDHQNMPNEWINKQTNKNTKLWRNKDLEVRVKVQSRKENQFFMWYHHEPKQILKHIWKVFALHSCWNVFYFILLNLLLNLPDVIKRPAFFIFFARQNCVKASSYSAKTFAKKLLMNRGRRVLHWCSLALCLNGTCHSALYDNVYPENCISITFQTCYLVFFSSQI